MRVTKNQRVHLAEMFREAANLIMAAVVVAAIVERRASFSLVMATLAVYAVIAVLTTGLRKGG